MTTQTVTVQWNSWDSKDFTYLINGAIDVDKIVFKFPDINYQIRRDHLQQSTLILIDLTQISLPSVSLPMTDLTLDIDESIPLSSAIQDCDRLVAVTYSDILRIKDEITEIIFKHLYSEDIDRMILKDIAERMVEN